MGRWIRDFVSTDATPDGNGDFDWFEETGLPPVPPRTRDDIIAEVKKSSPYRWWRLNHDYKWLQRKMKKMGYSPDDAKELLR